MCFRCNQLTSPYCPKIPRLKGNALLTLAIDSSNKSVSVALFEEQAMICSLHSADFLSRMSSGGTNQLFPVKKQQRGKSKPKRVFSPGASILLAPMIEDVLKSVQKKPAAIERIAIAEGPGLFTGLRVGIVTAKMIAFSNGANVIAVNTLEALAWRICQSKPDRDLVIRAVINAQRGQVFSATFDWKNGELKRQRPDNVLDRDSLIASCNANDFVVGNGIGALKLADEVLKRVTLVDENLWETDAKLIGQIGIEKAEKGVISDLWKLQPLYFKPSSAEEARLKAQKVED
ncbi:MAG: tRNA (adenosine(37)-N6)-threonylcarbamoyltransferase complex dimerization subunit type 1 TsaB [Planctomycetota bacterium]